MNILLTTSVFLTICSVFIFIFGVIQLNYRKKIINFIICSLGMFGSNFICLISSILYKKQVLFVVGLNIFVAILCLISVYINTKLLKILKMDKFF